MKKCPNCQNTYDDSLKFCQKDGTPLVAVAEDTPEESPFKTTVAKKDELPVPPEEKKPEPEPEPEQEVDPFKTMVAGTKMPPPKEDDVLEVPDKPIDPMATMVTGQGTSGNIEIDVPDEDKPLEPETPKAPAPPVEAKPDPPKAPEPPQPPVAKQEPVPPPPAAKPDPPKAPEPKPEPPKPTPAAEEKPASPIPSPFEESMPPGFQPPETPPFDAPESPVEAEQTAPEPKLQDDKKSAPEPLPNDFADVKDSDIEPAVVESSAPVPSFGQDMQSGDSAPPAAAEGESLNQTMAYISLGLGILSILCCVSILTGPAAIITGFMARGKINAEPDVYGGGTFALIGMILGVLGTILFVILMIVQFFLGGLANMSNF